MQVELEKDTREAKVKSLGPTCHVYKGRKDLIRKCERGLTTKNPLKYFRAILESER